MRNILDICCNINQNTYLTFNNFRFRKSCRLWDNVEKYGGAREATNDIIVWRIRVACWISNAICTHTLAHTRTHARACASLPTHTQMCNTYCFSSATLICERVSVLRYTYIVCLVQSLHRPAKICVKSNLRKSSITQVGKRLYSLHIDSVVKRTAQCITILTIPWHRSGHLHRMASGSNPCALTGIFCPWWLSITRDHIPVSENPQINIIQCKISGSLNSYFFLLVSFLHTAYLYHLLGDEFYKLLESF
jgi:hypothetical protein